jgi:2-polyprenyl-3-methyl-5-hydroxy-6-metoxy-1,4-benzoquinol methylase
MQLTDDWDERYRRGRTAWEDDEPAPSTTRLVLQNLPVGSSVLEIGCGRGVDSVWMAETGYRVHACDVSPEAIHHARERARAAGVQVDFRVADVLQACSLLPKCDAVFDRGVLHTFVTDEGRTRFAGLIAELLQPGRLWLSIAGVAATKAEARAAARRHEARVSAAQIAEAVEERFDIVSMVRTLYGFPGTSTDFPAFACVFRRRD